MTRGVFEDEEGGLGAWPSGTGGEEGSRGSTVEKGMKEGGIENTVELSEARAELTLGARLIL